MPAQGRATGQGAGDVVVVADPGLRAAGEGSPNCWRHGRRSARAWHGWASSESRLTTGMASRARPWPRPCRGRRPGPRAAGGTRRGLRAMSWGVSRSLSPTSSGRTEMGWPPELDHPDLAGVAGAQRRLAEQQGDALAVERLGRGRGGARPGRGRGRARRRDRSSISRKCLTVPRGPLARLIDRLVDLGVADGEQRAPGRRAVAVTGVDHEPGVEAGSGDGLGVHARRPARRR